MRPLIIAALLMPALAMAGHPCRNVRSFRQVAVAQQVQSYYQVNQQKAAPFVYGGDVDAFLAAQKELHRLEQGLGTQNLSHEQALLQLRQSTYQLRALSQQAFRSQALKHCDDSTPAPAAGPAPGPAPAGLAGKVVAIFTKRQCLACHGGQSKGGLNLVAGGQLTPQAIKAASCIFGEVFSGAMPKGMPDHRLEDEEIQTLAEWLSEVKAK